MDPLATFEAAEEERAERMAEAKREQDYAEARRVLDAVVAMRRQLYSRRGRLAYAVAILEAVWLGDTSIETAEQIDVLQAFDGHYGTDALLFVLAKALEAKS